MSEKHPHLIIVGGGLAGSLCALAIARKRPGVDLRLIERDETLGGNHVWSYFSSDVDDDMRWLTDAVTVQRWECNAVRFPAYTRVLSQPYNSITSERLDAVVSAELGERRIRADVVDLGQTHVTLANGTRLDALAVLDARGLTEAPEGLTCGWQKFVGQMLEVEGGHGLTHPVIMDATVDQTDGYRFVYLLPFDDNRVFVEDTYYEDDPALDRRKLAQRIGAYASVQGWENHRVLHEEQGVLPVVIDSEFDRFWPENDRVARVGVRAAAFHDLTSYSLPSAVRFAAWLLDALPMRGEELAAATRRYAARQHRDNAFYRLLGKMLFRAAEPSKRYVIFQRFYRLPDRLIARFYAGTSSFIDKCRILIGRPPVKISRAIRAILGRP